MQRSAGATLGLIDEATAASAAEGILEAPGADGIEVVMMASSTGVTRYARSEIIQNIARREVRAYVRAVVGNQTATATTNQLDKESLNRAASKAVEAARASRPDEQWPGLASPAETGRPQPLRRWDETTASATPGDRAAAIENVLAVAGDNAAGVYETSAHAYGVFSSTGVRCFDAHTRSVVTCLVDRGGATGWGEDASHERGAINVEGVARRALAKANAGRALTDVPPDVYEVVLEPSAVATMLDYLSFVGLGAKQVIEGESFLATRTGERVADPRVTIADDAAHPYSIGIGFDFEGVAKRRVAVIDKGVATGPVTDRRTAKILKRPVTGHSSGSNEFGPYAANVVMEGGDSSAESLVAGVENGLAITRFHYVNVLDRPATLLTGMTRDGTFRIKDGEVGEPVHNLRFTQNVLEALDSVKAIGRDLYTFAPEWGSFGSTVAPALRVGAFRFTSSTSH